MNVSAQTRRLARHGGAADELMLIGLSGFAVYHLALALWMAVDPHSFYKSIGPFGAYNAHYIRDTATFNAALGAGFAVAIVRPSWRLPLLAITTLQFALHTINHLVDIDRAHPEGIGYFDFFALLAATALLGLLLARGRAQDERAPTPRDTVRPAPERSSR